MVSITVGVRRGAEKAKCKAPRGIHVSIPNSFQQRTDVAIVKGGVAVSLRNWVVNGRTGEASCGSYLTHKWGAGGGPRESTLRGGSIEEIIWSVVMAVAMGAYDHVPE